MSILIVCDKRFNDYQFWTAVKVLKERKVEFTVTSTETVISEERGRRQFNIDQTLYDLEDVGRYEGLMLISGHPEDTRAYWHDEVLKGIVEKFADKPVGAICASCASIRYIATNKRVTGYPMQAVRDLLGLAGAIITPRTVVVDDKLVTAENELAAHPWANAFCDVLEGKVPNLPYEDVGEIRKLKMRKPIPEIERLK